jgi:hypothetical protein
MAQNGPRLSLLSHRRRPLPLSWPPHSMHRVALLACRFGERHATVVAIWAQIGPRTGPHHHHSPPAPTPRLAHPLCRATTPSGCSAASSSPMTSSPRQDGLPPNHHASHWEPRGSKSLPPPSPMLPGFVLWQPRGRWGREKGRGWWRHRARVLPSYRPEEATRGATV